MRRFCLMICVGLCAVSLSAKVDYYELIDSVEANIKEQKWDKAETFLMEVLRSYPDDNNNSLIISNLATVQRYQGKYSEAIKNYSFAINMTPNATTLLKNRASLYMDVDSVRKAFDDYDRVLMIDERDEESRYYHGILSMRLDDMETAKKDFDYILYFNPISGLGKEGRGMWHMKQDNYIEAVSCFTEIIKIYPSSLLLSKRAECYLALKNLNAATDDIRLAIEMTPEDGYLYVIRAKLNKARFNKTDAERDIKKAIECGLSKELVDYLINAEKR